MAAGRRGVDQGSWVSFHSTVLFWQILHAFQLFKRSKSFFICFLGSKDASSFAGHWRCSARRPQIKEFAQTALGRHTHCRSKKQKSPKKQRRLAIWTPSIAPHCFYAMCVRLIFCLPFQPSYPNQGPRRWGLDSTTGAFISEKYRPTRWQFD